MADVEGGFLERIVTAKAQGFLTEKPLLDVRHDLMQCDCRHD